MQFLWVSQSAHPIALGGGVQGFQISGVVVEIQNQIPQSAGMPRRTQVECDKGLDGVTNRDMTTEGASASVAILPSRPSTSAPPSHDQAAEDVKEYDFLFGGGCLGSSRLALSSRGLSLQAIALDVRRSWPKFAC